LCEDCLITITKSFKVPIYITEEDAPTEQVSVNTILPHSKNPGILEAIENTQPVIQRVLSANSVKSHIESSYKKDSIRLFFSGSFSSLNLTNEIIVKELDKLVSEGYLVRYYEIYSPDGHCCWKGSESLFNNFRTPLKCEDLDCQHIFSNIEELEEYKEVHYEMSSDWVKELTND
jgi:hypothetical protein